MFDTLARQSKERLGDCDLVTGMAVSWSGIYPKRQDPEVLRGQIAAARAMGARGFVVFRGALFEDAHFEVVREAR